MLLKNERDTLIEFRDWLRYNKPEALETEKIPIYADEPPQELLSVIRLNLTPRVLKEEGVDLLEAADGGNIILLTTDGLHFLKEL